MAENGSELRTIAWSHAFPFVRLFGTLRLALSFNRLLLAFLAVFLAYLGGRILDGLWTDAGGGVALMPRSNGTQSEIEVYVDMDRESFEQWRLQALESQQRRAVDALIRFGVETSDDAARAALQTAALDDLLLTDAFETERDELMALVEPRRAAGLAAIRDNADLTAMERQEQEIRLTHAADTLRMALTRTLPEDQNAERLGAQAAEIIAHADPAISPEDQSAQRRRFEDAATRMAVLAEHERLEPGGTFIHLLRHGSRCFTAAVHGVLTGHWGFSGGAYDLEPATLGSILSALRGVCWLVNQRPMYAFLFGVLCLLVFALFGGAICRSAAVQIARDQSISLGESVRFVAQRFGGFLAAPLVPLLVLLAAWFAMFVGGLVGAIPILGELFAGVMYGLAFLGGFVAAVMLLATVLGFPLMWPTIATEGSDGFDALSRACSYVGSRIWHCAFYASVLIAFGALSFVLVRLVVLLTLKLTHAFTGSGMNWASDAWQLDSVGKLDVLWQMPAWSDLAVLPGPDNPPLWGSFYNGPLWGLEWFTLGLIMLAVFVVVSLLGAFAVSYFFCGSTHMYFLLRRSVDATDWDEVYYEETEDDFGVPPVSETAGFEAASGAAPPATAPPSDAQAGDAPRFTGTPTSDAAPAADEDQGKQDEQPKDDPPSQS